MSPFLESTLAVALARLDKACDVCEKHPGLEGAPLDVRMAVMANVAVARNTLHTLQELIEVERDIIDRRECAVRRAAGT